MILLGLINLKEGNSRYRHASENTNLHSGHKNDGISDFGI